MSEDCFTLALTPSELSFVASLLGSSPRLLEDPFAGWPEERIRAALMRAQDSLVSHRYAQVQPDGRLVVDTAVAGLVGALAYADSALTITRLLDRDSQPSVRRVYFASGLIVEQEERNGQHEVTAVRDRETLLSRVQEHVRLSDREAIDVDPCTLSQSDLYEARCAAVVEGAEASAQILQEGGTSAATASALAQAMAGMECQSALLALHWERQEVRDLGRLTLLQGRHGIWLMRPLPDDADRMQVLPCDGLGAARQVEDLVNAVISAIPAQMAGGVRLEQG
jgi:hypothetical protein